MTSTASHPAPGLARYRNAAEWLHDLGDVPLERVVVDPPPGTATEADLIQKVEVERRLCELIDGTLVEKPTGYVESWIAARLINALGTFVDARQLGVVTGEAGMMRLRRALVRMPDVAYVSFDRFPNREVPHDAIASVAPDIAVEVLSKSNTAKEIDQKIKEYFGAGTRLVWVIDPPTRTAAAYSSPRARTPVPPEGVLNAGDVLPGFEVRLADLFVGLRIES